MLNNPLPVSAARQPRSIAKINGNKVYGLVSWEVDNNSFYQADTFRATIALSIQPSETSWAWWAKQTILTLEILVGFPKDPDNFTEQDLTSIIYGQVDDIDIDPVSDEIRISGRDLTAAFIDAKTFDKFPNRTSSAIAQLIAARHAGMLSKVVGTKTLAGKYYEIDHARLNHGETEWDLLTFLAHEEQFSVFVKGQTLYFQPKAQPSDIPYVIQWQPPTDAGYPQSNAINISMSRNLTLAKDIIVTVRSWNNKQKKGFTVKAQATHSYNTVLKGAAQPIGKAQTYFYTFAGLTKGEAQRRANALLTQLSSHERKITVDMPGDNLLTTENIVQLTGTGTAFDQIYFPDSIVRSFSFEMGYRMTITAKNHSTDSEASI